MHRGCCSSRWLLLVGAQRAHLIQSAETLQGKALLPFISLLGCRGEYEHKHNEFTHTKQTRAAPTVEFFECVGSLKKAGHEA